MFGIRAQINNGIVIFKSNVDLKFSESVIEDELIIQAGQIIYFSLSFSSEAPAVIPALDRTTQEAVIHRSVRWWETFAREITYEGSYQNVVVRSALTLKLLSHSPSGAIIAAPTTSLPERIGGDLNWDYRYCWLRDSSLTTDALVSVNLHKEARAFVNWLLHATNLTRPRLKVLYDIYGRKPQKEKTQPEFRGYFDSRPVRIGNQASEQDQLDVYGEVICAAVNILSNEQELDFDTQKMLKELGQYICQHWQQEDAGMWEVRGRKEHYTHSLLLCWAGLEGLLKLNEKGLIKKLDVGKIQQNFTQVAKALYSLAWNEDLQTFTSTLRGQNIDANLLLLSWYKFISADSPRMIKTYQLIKSRLSSHNNLLYRNRDGNEGTFILCSLWEVEYLALGGGTLKQAQQLFEHVLSFANDVGLLSEEIDPSTGNLLGNFPLAFSHTGVINAAIKIDERKVREEKVSQPEGAHR